MDLDFSYSSGFSENAQFLFSGFLTPQMNFAIHQLIQHSNYEIVPIMVMTSFTVDPMKEIFYFCTETAIYAYRQNSLVLLTKEFPSATVKYYGNGLLIFNPSSKDILRIVNVESSIEF